MARSAEWFPILNFCQASAIRRFSPWALASAGLLIFSGLFNSFFIVHTLDNLLGTAYGKALLVKAALVLLMIGLGALHYFRFRKAGENSRGHQNEKSDRPFSLQRTGALLFRRFSKTEIV